MKVAKNEEEYVVETETSKVIMNKDGIKIMSLKKEVPQDTSEKDSSLSNVTIWL